MDGIEAIVPVKELDAYYKMFDLMSAQFNINFEHEKYKFIHYKNVNNYTCLTESGKAKRKGFFKLKHEIPLGDATNEQIISIALDNYYMKNIPVKDTICNPENSILDYCCAKKISKDYEVYHNNIKVQNLNRYYFTKTGAFLLKKKKSTADKYKGSDTYEHLHVGNPVILYNSHVEKPFEEYDINYNYYISKCNQIILELSESKRVLKLF
jgi:hypothetical protein